MSSSTSTNRIKVGEDVGIPTKNTIGTVELIQAIPVTGASKMVSAALPTNSALTRAPYFVISSAFAVSAVSGANPTAGGGVLYIPYIITQDA